MENRPIRTAVDYIKSHSRLVLTTHEAPDGDGLGSVYALARGLISLGKDCLVVISQSLPEKFKFLDTASIFKGLDSWAPPPDILEYAGLILDTNDRMNLGAFSDAILPRLKEFRFIDHHQAPEGEKPQGWIDTQAAATAEMVLDILGELGCKIEPDMASALLTGIIYDTGSFVYSKTGARCFDSAKRLVEHGASPTAIHRELNESSSTAALLLMKAAVSSMELSKDSRIASMVLTKEAFIGLGARYEDAEGIINIPLSAKDVQVSILIKEGGEGALRCSLRSKGGINVASIAQHFGGGGHAAAAGFKHKGSIAEAKETLLALTSLVLDGGSIPKPARLARDKTPIKGEKST